MELLISMLKNIMMIICGGILSLYEIQMKIGEAEKYYSVEFFRWGAPLRRKFVCQKEWAESPQNCTRKISPKKAKNGACVYMN